MKNKEIADIFRRMGTLLEIKDENVFKVRAYYKAAENLQSLPEDVAVLQKENRLGEVGGLGKTMQEKIAEYLETGKISAYEKLTKEIPESFLEMVEIPSLGPKKAKLFYDKLGITSVAELEKAARSGRLLELPKIKQKTVDKILDGIRIVKAGQERMDLGTATRIAGEFVGDLKKLKEVKRIEVAGSLRRGRETVRDIDILVDSSDPKKVMDVFVHLPQVKSVNAHGDTKSSVMTRDNVQVDLRVVDPECFGAALLYFTGSKNFNVRLRQIAIKKKMKVSEYGVFSVKKDLEKCLASRTEEDCLKALGLPYVPPELREDIGETLIFDGKQLKLPKLISQKDLKGEFHVHSTYSDGRNTIEEMVQKAMALGYQYLAVSDHSEKLRVARGVSAEDLKKKKKEIDRLNKKYRDFRILFGSEVEIDADGNLDYNDKILSEFDVVIAAVHTHFTQSRQQLTNRLVKACRNRHVNIIAHPTGVHIGKRKPYDIDLKEVCKAAVDHNTFLEINSFPIRLDLDSSNAYYARQQGVKFVVNSDAHAIGHMDYICFGVSVARRGWLTKKDVLNTQPLTAVLKALKK